MLSKFLQFFGYAIRCNYPCIYQRMNQGFAYVERRIRSEVSKRPERQISCSSGDPRGHPATSTINGCKQNGLNRHWFPMSDTRITRYSLRSRARYFSADKPALLSDLL